MTLRTRRELLQLTTLLVVSGFLGIPKVEPKQDICTFGKWYAEDGQRWQFITAKGTMADWKEFQSQVIPFDAKMTLMFMTKKELSSDEINKFHQQTREYFGA